MKTITEIIKIKMVKNMEVKMKMIWASSYHFREIPHFYGILPYFTDRNTVSTYNTSRFCYLYLESHDPCILTPDHKLTT